MTVDITIPSPGESITEVTLGAWKKADGAWIEKDDLLAEIESDKATLELRAPASGSLKILQMAGEGVKVGAAVGAVDTNASKPAGSAASASIPAAIATTDSVRASGVAKKVAAEKGVDLAAVQGSGTAGRVMKNDVLAATASTTEAKPVAKSTIATMPATATPATRASSDARGARREKMPKIRVKIAERLLQSQQTTATLTTFNEIDMTEVMRLRTNNKEAFEKQHYVSLGFMSFFVKAAVSALQKYPRVNAYIIGDEFEYHDFCDVSVAVGTDRGLVVPVLRNAETMSFAQIENAIRDFALRARDGKLTVDEMTGGTFTVSNGGVYGSLLATPILNPPQSAILGMHGIKKRAVEDPNNPGQIALRPMMYIALSYDHRIIDGAESVGFLKHIKDCIEHPERLLLGV
ncbi:MAG: 2-oxoglutarate dehydrogenase complex dihydrolipoyllysine-residue succinyltransferase [Phycisphaerales bacterium]|nr:2-oxoglutarate dehydrogenase complex dihydrolipoyllysine-residue succinyltransferase [Phycisphaerales bacterium]